MNTSLVIVFAVLAMVAVVVSADAPAPVRVKPQQPTILAQNGCPPGQFLSLENNTCQPCAAGTASAVFGSRQYCTRCASGYSTNGLTGLTVCSACVAGQYANQEQRDAWPTCQPCAARNYGDKPAMAACITCPAGSICPSQGMTAPQLCPIAQASSTGQIACIVCKAGFYAEKAGTAAIRIVTERSGNTGEDSCPACDAGEWSPAASDTCWPCDAGTYNPSGGMSACHQCEYATCAGKEGMTQCDKCAAGTYQPTVGQSSCLTCPAGQTSPPQSAICSVDGKQPTINNGFANVRFAAADAEADEEDITLLEFEAEMEAENEAENEAEAEADSEEGEPQDGELLELESEDVPKRPASKQFLPKKRPSTHKKPTHPPPHPMPVIPAKFGNYKAKSNPASKLNRAAATAGAQAKQKVYVSKVTQQAKRGF